MKDEVPSWWREDQRPAGKETRVGSTLQVHMLFHQAVVFWTLGCCSGSGYAQHCPVHWFLSNSYIEKQDASCMSWGAEASLTFFSQPCAADPSMYQRRLRGAAKPLSMDAAGTGGFQNEPYSMSTMQLQLADWWTRCMCDVHCTTADATMHLGLAAEHSTFFIVGCGQQEK